MHITYTCGQAREQLKNTVSYWEKGLYKQAGGEELGGSVKIRTEKPTELSLLALTDSGQKARDHHGTDLGPLHLGDSCITFVGPLAVGQDMPLMHEPAL